VVTLSNPSEEAKQPACTSLCQFIVRDCAQRGAETEAKVEALDLLLHQRSSDVIVGLAYDMIVWSTILHLVCREVRRRTEGSRPLKAGRLQLSIGSAHVYDINLADAETLMEREAISDTVPSLHVDPSAGGIFEIANNFDGGPSLLKVLGYSKEKAHAAIKVEVAGG
jgi:thymidylate synthase